MKNEYFNSYSLDEGELKNVIGIWRVRRKTCIQTVYFRVKRFLKTAKLSLLTEKTLL